MTSPPLPGLLSHRLDLPPGGQATPPPSRWCGTPPSKPSQQPSMDRQGGMGCRVRPPAHRPARLPARRLPWSPPPSLRCRSGSRPWPLATATHSPAPFARPSRCQRPPHRWPGSSTRRGTGSGLRSFWPRPLAGDGSSLELGPPIGPGLFFCRQPRDRATSNSRPRAAPWAPGANGSRAAGPKAPSHRSRGTAALAPVTSPSHPGGGKAEPLTRAQGCGMGLRGRQRQATPSCNQETPHS